MTYRNSLHRVIFNSFLESKREYNLPPAVISAAFLLSADSKLWRRAKHHLRRNELYFERITADVMSPDRYVLLRTAQDLYEDTIHLSLTDITDRNVISDEMFELIAEAIRIRRYGVKSGDARC